MTEKTIRADEVKVGHAVTRITSAGQSAIRHRPVAAMDQGVRKKRGKWPTVVAFDYLKRGEGGEPTVYLYLSDRPKWTYCLAPGDNVTIEER